MCRNWIAIEHLNFLQKLRQRCIEQDYMSLIFTSRSGEWGEPPDDDELEVEYYDEPNYPPELPYTHFLYNSTIFNSITFHGDPDLDGSNPLFSLLSFATISNK